MSALTASRAESAARVAALKAQGFNGIQIAERTGMSRSYVYELLKDPDGSEVRARKDSYRRPCPRCGKLMDGSNGHGANASKLCERCDRAEAVNSLQRRRAAATKLTGRVRWTDEQILAALRLVAGTADTVTAKTYREIATSSPLLPSGILIHRRLGWNRALVAAGLKPNRPANREYRSIGPEVCLAALCQLTDELGRPPTMREYERMAPEYGYPSATTIRNRLGSWGAACKMIEDA